MAIRKPAIINGVVEKISKNLKVLTGNNYCLNNLNLSKIDQTHWRIRMNKLSIVSEKLPSTVQVQR